MSSISHPERDFEEIRSRNPTNISMRYFLNQCYSKIIVLTGNSTRGELNGSQTFKPKSATLTVGCLGTSMELLWELHEMSVALPWEFPNVSAALLRFFQGMSTVFAWVRWDSYRDSTRLLWLLCCFFWTSMRLLWDFHGICASVAFSWERGETSMGLPWCLRGTLLGSRGLPSDFGGFCGGLMEFHCASMRLPRDFRRALRQG